MIYKRYIKRKDKKKSWKFCRGDRPTITVTVRDQVNRPGGGEPLRLQQTVAHLQQ